MVLKLSWERNPDVPYPNIWHTFEAKGQDNETVQYKVQDLPENRHDEAFDVFLDAYMKHEPLAIVLDLRGDAESVELYKSMMRVAFKQKISLVCIDVAADKIVGVSVLWVISKEDNFGQQLDNLNASRPMRILIDSVNVLYKDFDLFETYNVDKYLGSFGLAVAEGYRNRGISREILKTRKILGKTFGLKLTNSGFSSAFSSRSALSVGFVVNRSKSFKEMSLLDPKFAPYANVDSIHDNFITATWVF